MKLNKIFIPHLRESNLAHFSSCKEVHDDDETNFLKYVNVGYFSSHVTSVLVGNSAHASC